jgi:hypothetical protein
MDRIHELMNLIPYKTVWIDILVFTAIVELVIVLVYTARAMKRKRGRYGRLQPTR